MKPRIRFMAVCFTIALAIAPLWGMAQSDSDWNGKIESVNTTNNSITVDDRVFQLHSGTIFHGSRSNRSSLYPGMTVRIKFTIGPAGVPVANEIWTQ